MAYSIEDYPADVLSDEEVAAEAHMAAMERIAALRGPEALTGLYDIEGGGYTGAPLFIPRFGGGSSPAPSSRFAAPQFSAAVLRRMMNPATSRSMFNRLRNAGVSFGQPRVREVPPGRVGRAPVGMDSGATIAAGASSIITQTMQTVFKPQRLMVPASLAPFFVIDDFRVGQEPVFAAAGSIPAEAFVSDSEVSSNVNPNATAQAGVSLILTVTNIDGAPHRFRAAIFGENSFLNTNCG
jgi:hypothetical protein